jgi:hypothetical protein
MIQKMQNKPNLVRLRRIYNLSENKELQQKINNGHLVKTNPIEPIFKRRTQDARRRTKKCKTKPIFKGQKMNINLSFTKDYENEQPGRPGQNKTNLARLLFGGLTRRSLSYPLYATRFLFPSGLVPPHMVQLHRRPPDLDLSLPFTSGSLLLFSSQFFTRSPNSSHLLARHFTHFCKFSNVSRLPNPHFSPKNPPHYTQSSCHFPPATVH